MKIARFIILAGLVFYAFSSFSQDTLQVKRKIERATLGVGIGFDYGGYGANLTVYPERHIGLFVGVGYALIGPGVNAGLKFRAIAVDPRIFNPFLLAMYGYTSAIKVKGASEYNKFFYSPTFGIGFETNITEYRKGIWSFAVLVPVRGYHADDYITYLKTNYNIKFDNVLWPVTISVGCKIKI